MERKLILIGTWLDVEDSWWNRLRSPWIHPSKLGRHAWPADEKAGIVKYLRSGIERSAQMGFSFCRFRCGAPDDVMGCRELTDGRWLWPEGLAHYVETHDIPLPDEFVAHAKGNGFAIPGGIDTAAFDEERDTQFWIARCKAHAKRRS